MKFQWNFWLHLLKSLNFSHLPALKLRCLFQLRRSIFSCSFTNLINSVLLMHLHSQSTFNIFVPFLFLVTEFQDSQVFFRLFRVCLTCCSLTTTKRFRANESTSFRLKAFFDGDLFASTSLLNKQDWPTNRTLCWSRTYSAMSESHPAFFKNR